MIMVIAVVALIFSILAFMVGAFSLVQVEAMKRSTHQITYIDPTKQNFENLSREEMTTFQKDDETLESH